MPCAFAIRVLRHEEVRARLLGARPCSLRGARMGLSHGIGAFVLDNLIDLRPLAMAPSASA